MSARVQPKEFLTNRGKGLFVYYVTRGLADRFWSRNYLPPKSKLKTFSPSPSGRFLSVFLLSKN